MKVRKILFGNSDALKIIYGGQPPVPQSTLLGYRLFMISWLTIMSNIL